MFKLTIETSDGFRSDESGEVSRTMLDAALRNVADSVMAGNREGYVRDAYSNYVGHWELCED